MNIKHFAGGMLMLALLLVSFPALAAPGDFRLEIRNTDDTAYTPVGVPTRAASGTAAVLGGRILADAPSWYYFEEQHCFDLLPGNYPEDNNNYKLAIIESCLDIEEIGGFSDEVGDLIENAVDGIEHFQPDWNQSSTTALDYIKNKPSIPSDYQWFVTEVNANLFGTSTTMLVDTSSTTAGFITQEDKDKLDSLSTSYLDLTDKPTLGIAYEGTTQRTDAFPVFKNATVSSGTAVFHLTDDGLSGGNALFPNGVIIDSIDAEVNDATASYQMSYVLSNGDKTITVTANKLTTANILTGLLGQTQANGSVVRLTAWGY